MRAVVQRVTEASVTVAGTVRGVIPSGVVILLAIEEPDTLEDVRWLSGKVTHLRIFDDENHVMNCSVRDVQGEILVISQFTLFASTRKGNRPSYSRSARSDIAAPLYEQFLAQVARDLGRPVQAGEFGADMAVRLVNNGPVTIILDSRARE